MEIDIDLNHLRPGIRYTFKRQPPVFVDNVTGTLIHYMSANLIPRAALLIGDYEINGVRQNGTLSTPLNFIQSASVIVLPQLNGDLNHYVCQYT